MIKIENTKVYGISEAIQGMRNPRLSHAHSDSQFDGDPIIGPKDGELMQTLSAAGGSHAKFRRMVTLYADITAPFYWWKQFDTYKVGTVTNSTSTIDTICKKNLEISDFSFDYLNDPNNGSPNYITMVLRYLNELIERYRSTNNSIYLHQLLELLPESYNQKRKVMLNYETLSHMYTDRKNHRLDEWVYFCKWIENLPYAKYTIV